MTYRELGEIFINKGGDTQVSFNVISQNQVLFGNNEAQVDIICLQNDEPIIWQKDTSYNNRILSKEDLRRMADTISRDCVDEIDRQFAMVSEG